MTLFVLLPPILVIALALWKRNVYLALVVGLCLSEWMMAQGNSLSRWFAPLERLVAVFSSPGQVRILLFCLAVGALVALLDAGQGIHGLVNRMTRSRGLRHRRWAALVPIGIGMMLFVETTMSALTAGLFGRQLGKVHQLRPHQLAFFIDATCAPVSILVLLNGWGAYLLGLLTPYWGAGATEILFSSVIWNVYPWVILGLALYSAWSGRFFFQMAQPVTPCYGEKETPSPGSLPEETNSWVLGLMPLVVLVVSMFFLLWLTGSGQWSKGAGDRSVLYAVILTMLFLLLALHLLQSKPLADLTDTALQGASSLLPLAFVMLLSFAFGDSLKALGTGELIGSLVGPHLPGILLPIVLFLVAGTIAFATGTSWGTYALMIPLAIPLIHEISLPPALGLAALLGGGVFGDHCSPISDTTLISSMAADCDHLAHVRTQLPYGLLAGAVSLVAYGVAAWLAG
jgi:Na+/H+ antiporter NhaC